MSEQDHGVFEALVDGYYAGALAPARVDEMRQHLRDCDACRARYDRLALAEQQVVGPATARVLADQRIVAAVVQGSAQPAAPAAGRRWWLAFVLAPTAVVAAAIGFAFLVEPVADSDRLVARGPGVVSATVGVGVAAVEPQSGQVYDARRPEGVSLAHRLRFSYTNSAGSARYLFLLGVDDGLQPYWYFPLPEERASVAIENGPRASQLPLPYETELVRRHHVGRLRVVALFSPQPIALTAVEAALTTARAGQRTLDQVVWPGQPTVQVVDLVLVTGTAP